MKKSLTIPLFLLLMIFSVPVYSQSDSEQDGQTFTGISKNHHILTIEVKRYFLFADEEIVLYGAKERKFLTNNWYWGEAGYGSILGKRGGYLEGGVIFGYWQLIEDMFLFDLRVFLGAGGGGGALSGKGGLLINPTLGLGFKVDTYTGFLVEFGYLEFVNGNIESLTIAFSLNYDFWALNL